MFITRRICIARDEKAVEVYVALEASDNTVEPEGELTPEDDTANRYPSLGGEWGVDHLTGHVRKWVAVQH